MQNRLVFAVGLALVAGAPAAHAAPFFTGLGILPGATSSEAAAVSADGSTVVGTSGADAFRWTAAEGMAALERPGVSFARATDVSADGSVIVGSFRWMVGMVSTGPGGVAVSSDGTVVVGGVGDGVYRWTESEGTVRIPVLDDFTIGNDIRFSSYPTDISGDGSAIVGYWFDGDETWNAFRWSVAGGLTGAGGDIAYAVSSDGSTVVGQRNNFDNGFGGWWPREAHLWTMGQQAVGLGFLRPFEPDVEDDRRESAALAVSDEGMVVGWSCCVLGFPREAFLWDSLDGMRSVREVLESEYGLDLTGWTLTSATGITPDGRTIVGTGTNPDGATEAWIAFVPEPGTVGLLALGLAALAARGQGRKVVASWRSSQ